jgi:hypothetical protein
VQNFYKFFTITDEKIHNDINVTVLQAVSCLISIKVKTTVFKGPPFLKVGFLKLRGSK